MSIIIFGIESYQLTNKEKKWLRNKNAAGVILFARNYQDKEQLKDLCANIRNIAPHLVLCVDHEGGRVQRFRDGFTALPPLKNIGDLYEKNPNFAKKMARNVGIITAEELRDFDFTLAPVLDLYNPISKVIGNRAFSEHPEIVQVLATALREGLKIGGMEAVGKHYAGHGNIETDSHQHKCFDFRSASERACDKEIFLKQIADGLKGVMTSHIYYPEDPKTPASLSSIVMNELRKVFNGFVITDDLDMTGSETGESHSQRVQKALNAGADCVLICNNFAAIDEALNANYVQDIASVKRLNLMKRTRFGVRDFYLSAKNELEIWLAN